MQGFCRGACPALINLSSGPQVLLKVETVILDANGKFVDYGQLAGGQPLSVSLSNSDPTVATISPSTVLIQPGSTSADVTVTPLKVGSTIVAITATPTGFATPQSLTSIEVDVQ